MYNEGDSMYYVGQRVFSDEFGFGNVVYTSDDNYNMAIEFDRPNGILHDCTGHTAKDRGWWYGESEADILLEKVKAKFPVKYILTFETRGQVVNFRKWLGKQTHNLNTFQQVLRDIDDPLAYD
jgi:hypothetical protein